MTYNISGEKLLTEAVIDLPASKSLSNRALILKALCEGNCHLTHLSDCDDTRVMLQAFEQTLDTQLSTTTIDIGAAGTSMRFLTAYFAQKEGSDVIMTGTARMKERPIAILVDALRELGADISYEEKEGFPPLRIKGKKLKGGELTIDGGTSSQYISAIMMIAPRLEEGLTLHLSGQLTSRPYIEMTRQMMREFGATTEWIDEQTLSIAHQTYTAKAYEVESDWSAASYWYEILTLGNGFAQSPRYLLKGLKKNSLQGDSRVKDFFAELGIRTVFTKDGAQIWHLKEDSSFYAENNDQEWEEPEKLTWDLSDQPDLAQTLITTCCQMGYPFDITGLHTLRIKETDRIAALQTELAKFGYMVEVEGDDRMTYDGKDKSANFVGAIVDTYHDHRMAMAFAPLGICQQTYIDNPEVVSKSYPTYWEDLRSAGFTVTEISEGRQAVERNLAKAQERKERIHSEAKWILNTILVAIFLIIVWFIFH